MNVTKRRFLGSLGLGAVTMAVSGSMWSSMVRHKARIALQLYSIRHYIGGKRDVNGNVVGNGVGLERALDDIAELGFTGVEFVGYYQFTTNPNGLKKALSAAGIRPCGTHVSNSSFGFDVKEGIYDSEVLKRTCDFNMSYGNSLVICPGGGNIPPGVTWSTGRGGGPCRPSQRIDDFIKRLVELYNKAATDAARFGCRIGLHNHTWEHAVKMQDGTTFWDYFFANTDRNVCMEQDVGWSTCAGVIPKEQYWKYPHRSPTLHAKENGMGEGVTTFDGILGRPGIPGARPVDWDGLIPVTEQDGVQWYVVECERHAEDLSAVRPSCNFLKSKGLNRG